MQTFLLFLNLWRSFAALDVRRLGKQRVEAFHIWKVITGIEPAGRWRYAPAVRMWYGHDEVLKLYILICCRSWELRGGRNDLMRKYIHQYGINRIDHDRLAKQFPVWLTGYPGRILTESHRSQLCRKNPVTYRRFWPYLGLHKGYWWPVPSVPRSSAIGHDETLARFGQHELNLQNGTRVNLVAEENRPRSWHKWSATKKSHQLKMTMRNTGQGFPASYERVHAVTHVPLETTQQSDDDHSESEQEMQEYDGLTEVTTVGVYALRHRTVTESTRVNIKQEPVASTASTQSGRDAVHLAVTAPVRTSKRKREDSVPAAAVASADGVEEESTRQVVIKTEVSEFRQAHPRRAHLRSQRV